MSTSEQLGWLQRTVCMLPPVGLPSINGEDRSSSGSCKADITNLIGEEKCQRWFIIITTYIMWNFRLDLKQAFHFL